MLVATIATSRSRFKLIVNPAIVVAPFLLSGASLRSKFFNLCFVTQILGYFPEREII